jgi:hypothetical protein
MSFGNNPADSAQGKWHTDPLRAKADADRAARLAGHKSPFRRLLERLRPHRQEPGEPHGSYGTLDDAGSRPRLSARGKRSDAAATEGQARLLRGDGKAGQPSG